MDKLSLLDSFEVEIDDGDLSLPSDHFICYECGKEVDDDVFYIADINNQYIVDTEFSFCRDCYENGGREKFNHKVNNIELSTDNKVSYKRCIVCKDKIGNRRRRRITSRYFVFDGVCENCDIKDLIFRKIENGLVSRESTLISLHKVEGKYIHKELESEVTDKRIQSWIQVISSICNIPHIDIFGSFKQWVEFTDPYDHPCRNVYTSLLVDCSPTTNGRIASLLVNNHGRISIDIVFDTVEQYMEEYKKWKDNYSPEKQKKAVELLADDYEQDDSVYIDSTEEFSGYIRYTKNLGFHYG